MRGETSKVTVTSNERLLDPYTKTKIRTHTKAQTGDRLGFRNKAIVSDSINRGDVSVPEVVNPFVRII